MKQNYFMSHDDDDDDNMRGWDPASEDDTHDNGMGRWSDIHYYHPLERPPKSHLHQPLPHRYHGDSLFRTLFIISNQQALPVIVCLGILHQWWHLPVVSGLILDAVGYLYG